MLADKAHDAHGAVLFSPAYRREVTVLIVVDHADVIVVHDCAARAARAPAEVLIFGAYGWEPFVKPTQTPEEAIADAQILGRHTERSNLALRAPTPALVCLGIILYPQPEPSECRQLERRTNVGTKLRVTTDDAIRIIRMLRAHGEVSADVVAADNNVVIQKHEDLPAGHPGSVVPRHGHA
jgi:hypothetical protein